MEATDAKRPFARGRIKPWLDAMFGDAWRVRDMREKMRSSNGRERP